MTAPPRSCSPLPTLAPEETRPRGAPTVGPVPASPSLLGSQDTHPCRCGALRSRHGIRAAPPGPPEGAAPTCRSGGGGQRAPRASGAGLRAGLRAPGRFGGEAADAVVRRGGARAGLRRCRASAPALAHPACIPSPASARGPQPHVPRAVRLPLGGAQRAGVRCGRDLPGTGAQQRALVAGSAGTER